MQTHSSAGRYRGILFIGDPHLASRAVGFRKDDYPRAVLRKLTWCFEYCREQRLLPAILGDIFHHARDNQNWLLGELLEILGTMPEVIAIYGNHDCREAQLTEDDSLSVILKAGALRLLDVHGPWRGAIVGRTIVIGGSSYKQPLPGSFSSTDDENASPPLVFWMAHHDIFMSGAWEHGNVQPGEIPGVDMVINGHVHAELADVQIGNTLWVTPGGIARISRSDATRRHVPRVLKITIDENGTWQREIVEVPHEAFEEVFYEELGAADEGREIPRSAFVAGLAELQSRRTESGAGLMQFLTKNVTEFEPAVAQHVLALAQEVIDGDITTDEQ